MEAYSIQVIELLSLGKSPDGCCRIKVGVIHEDRQASYVIDIDEFTYLGLNALRPLNGGRVRLSPYPKWDPYRNTYYSAIFRTTGVSRDTLYFACSEAYIKQIEHLRTLEPPPAPTDDGCQSGPVEKWTEHRRQLQLRRTFSHSPRVVGLLLAACCLPAVLSIPSERFGLPAHGGSLSGYIGAAKAAAATGSSGKPAAAAPLEEKSDTKAAPPEIAANQPAPTEDPAQPVVIHKDYEVMDIDEGKKFFGLPKPYVALTFDDGPSPLTQKIVDILTEQSVAATFLFVGQNAKRYPDAVTYASEHGMSIGDHSWDHSMLTKASPADQAQNMEKTNSVLESLTQSPVTLFRPPYGAVNDELVSAAKEQHMKTLLWNRDPEDWNAKKPEDILKYFHEVEASGGVYVLHEDKNTVEALPDIIQYLKEKNLTFVVFK